MYRFQNHNKTILYNNVIYYIILAKVL